MDEFLTVLGDWIYDLLADTLGMNLFYNLGINLWNWAMTMIGAVATTTPQSFSSTAWAYATTDVLNFTTAFGGTLLNLFYMIGVVRQSTNLKENFTLEIFVENMIKMLLANMLILNGLELMKSLFQVASGASGMFLLDNFPTITSANEDVGSLLFNMVFGIVFFIVAAVCTFTIFMTLYSRYLQLYMLVALYPIAFSTLPGGQGVYSTASSFVRTFLSKTFEIVVIAVAVSIGAKMCSSIDFGMVGNGLGSAFDGAIQSLQSMATMIIMAGAVKGVDTFMRRAFGL